MCIRDRLYKGNMINAGVTSPYTLYDEQTASFGEDEDYNQADATGFINLFGPVSYTHLDVYKRQAQQSPHFNERGGCWVNCSKRKTEDNKKS